jgi:hypothetical protein
VPITKATKKTLLKVIQARGKRLRVTVDVELHRQPGGAFEVAAIALNFYLLGRRSRDRQSVCMAAAVFAYWPERGRSGHGETTASQVTGWSGWVSG